MLNSTTTINNEEPSETDKTDKTDFPDNWEFLAGIFGTAASDARPVVVSFAGDPLHVPKKSWNCHAWNEDDALPADKNNYFTLAAFRPDDAGRYRRQKKHFVALHAVMLDDIGGKIPAERVTVAPSWWIETSPDNFQIGYILADPITDFTIADRLMNAIVSAKLCDPGANGPTARLARLPVGVNGKHQPSFSCRMTEWQPDRRYTIDELVNGLELDMQKNTRSRPQGERQSHCHDDDAIKTPRPAVNAVIVALRQRDLYKTPLGDGKHDITCPWVNEHTDAIDGGTAYFEPSDQFPIGGFKCHHGHCVDRRHIRDLLQFLCIEVNAARMKATIRVIPGAIHRVVDAAEEELAKTGRHYQRGGLIVTIITDPGTRETKIMECNQPSLVQALAGAATWEKFDGRSKEQVAIDPPPRHVAVLYDASSYKHLPVLNGLARQPYFRLDGTLVTTPGYDAATGMFGVFDEKEFNVPENPTKEQAREALDKLAGLLNEFPFATEADRAAALSAMLTAAMRSRLPFAPMIHVRAHQPGSGKSYLCSLITAFATPQKCTPLAFPKDNEECRKLLLSELLHGPAVIQFDNLTGDLVPHKSLCIALTSEYWTDRILGVSKTATVSTAALFLSSGNNVGPVQDMTRRCITINLDPQCETPATREFKRPDLVAEVLAKRGEYVSAALTINRAWIIAGRPRMSCPSLAGFDQWSDFCRQPLLWLGYADPTKSVFEAMADDPDRETLERLLNVWLNCFGKRPTMVREAVNRAYALLEDKDHELNEVLKDIAGEKDNIINRRSLGRWIKRQSGRIVNGLRFMRASGSRSAEAWYVESVSSVSSVSREPGKKVSEESDLW